MQDIETVVVVAAGATVAPDLPDGAFVVAADGGVDAAHRLGLTVDVAIGDFDSISPDALIEAEERGARVERHPTAKDATDLELALDRALTLAPARLVVLASGGGRLDHLVSSLLLLTAERYSAVEIDACLGGARAHVVRRERAFDGKPGELVTLLAVAGAARGVSTEGLLYPLDRETLEPGSSRGVSNVFVASRATVAVEDGVLLAIRPRAVQETA